jgi:membrane protein implicated in regulation of membrane protease activity
MWWVIAAVALGVLELFALDLVFANLVVAALAAAGVAALGGSFTAQALTAAVTAAVLLTLVRPALLKRLRVQGELHRTGTDAHVGRAARVLAQVDDLGGRVKLAGEEWSARSARPGEVFPAGAPVRVVAIDGATAVVTVPEQAPGTTTPDGGP